MGSTIDMGSRDAAQAMANRIMDYWGRRGFTVVARVVPTSARVQEAHGVDNYTGYGVRSDLINGWPQEVMAQRERAALA